MSLLLFALQVVPKSAVRRDRRAARSGRRRLGQLERVVKVYAHLRWRHLDAESPMRPSDAGEWRLVLRGRTHSVSGVQRERAVSGKGAEFPGETMRRLQPSAISGQADRLAAVL